MKTLKWLLTVVLVLVLLAVAFSVYMGLFGKTPVHVKMMGPYTGIYEPFTGDYMKTGPVFQRVADSLKQDGVEVTKFFGIYFDDPRKVAKEQLRSEVGVLLEEKDIARAKELEKKYKVKTLDQRMSLVVDLPIRNRLSYALGPMKAYPALDAYAREKNLKVVQVYEIYDVPAKRTHYVMSLIENPSAK
jgi:hypothetical protein